MANPMYGQNKFDNSADAIIGDNGEAYIKRNVIAWVQLQLKLV